MWERSLPWGISYDQGLAQGPNHAQQPDSAPLHDPVLLADLVLLHRPRRRSGTRIARDVARADPANPVRVSGRLSLQMAAADGKPHSRRYLYRPLHLRFHS